MSGTRELGARLALIFMACLALIVSTSVALNAYFVRTLQQEMLQDGYELAEERGRNLAEKLASVLAGAGGTGDVKDSVTADRLRSEIQISINDKLAFGLVVDNNLNLSVAEYGGSSFPLDQVPREIEEYRKDLETVGGDRVSLFVKRRPGGIPLRAEKLGASGLSLVYGIRESEVLKDIERAGAQITRRAFLMAGAAILGLAVAFALVWWHVRRQLALQQENERLGRMAYVGTLASGLAHEIRNPLNAMTLNLDMVEEDLTDPREDSEDRVRRILSHLRTEVGQLEGAVSGFLSYALPRERRGGQVSPAETLQDALDTLAKEIQNNRIETRLQLDPDLRIVGDRAGLRQVFHNLILNATQAMTGPDKILTIRCWREDGKARLSVADTGSGIPPDSAERIFEPFVSGRAGGLGFGLPIAERIVRELGGRVWVEANRPAGSVFQLEFPLPSRRA